MFSEEFEEHREDLFWDGKWQVEADGSSVLLDQMSGIIIERKPPIYLPDGTTMDHNRFFRVEAASDVEYDEGKFLEKNTFLLARRYLNGNIYLFTDSVPPFLLSTNAELGIDFRFITELERFTTGDLQVKLRRVLLIENYEMAALIRDELNKRGVEVKPKRAADE